MGTATSGARAAANCPSDCRCSNRRRCWRLMASRPSLGPRPHADGRQPPMLFVNEPPPTVAAGRGGGGRSSQPRLRWRRLLRLLRLLQPPLVTLGRRDGPTRDWCLMDWMRKAA
eukprot:scaffold1190_cov393-Prasinococcus_capsulatus_cf.AAC.29